MLQLLYTWTASADVMAMSTVEYNLENLAPGDATTIKWRGKPVFVRHRNGEEIAAAQGDDGDTSMRDTEFNVKDRTHRRIVLDMAYRRLA